MTTQTCHTIGESYRSSLVGIELDDTQTQMLLSIASSLLSIVKQARVGSGDKK
ncbi:hypothetical protein PAE9249_05221 [Paenibacillus sp. CECT 9249]|nr:hypothetical protein PAE9249_05221 [Paenibacillus sp. CECT 9249]